MADVIVTGDRGDSGVGAGMIIGILIVIIAAGFAIWYFGFGGFGTSHTTNVNVSPPQVNVNNPAPAAS